ncbi:MAG: hypothetical protein WC378_20230 [Opitutaceae bacterium]|jgi:hypothetical protein
MKRIVAVILITVAGFFLWRNEILGFLRQTVEPRPQISKEAPDISRLPAAQSMLAANWENDQVLRAAAEYLDLLNDPAAIAVRRRLVELAPSDSKRHLDLVMCALRYKNFAAALDALQQSHFFDIGDDDRFTFELLEASAARRSRAMEVLFDQMRTQGANSPEYTLRLNALRLQLAPASIASLAVSEIQKLAYDPQMRAACMRELIRHFMRTGDSQTAKRFVHDLTTAPGSSFEDMLLGADVFLITRRKSQDELNAELTPQAQGSPASAAQFAAWLVMQGRTAAASKWLDRLPRTIADNPELVAAKADLAVSRQDWKQLEALLMQKAWGSIQPEALRLAMSSRLLSDRHSSEIRKQMWDQALTISQSRLESLRILLRLARIWKWEPQIEATLQAVANSHAGESWVFWTLGQIAAKAGETAKLRDIYRRWHEADPGNLLVENECAMLALLATPDQPNSETRAIVARLNAGNPRHPAFAISHAFSLWQQGLAPDALFVLLKLRTYELREPRRALYCALILIDNGKTDIAEKYFQLIEQDRLLPEEKQLLKLARSKIQETARHFLDESEVNDDPAAMIAPSRPARP